MEDKLLVQLRDLIRKLVADNAATPPLAPPVKVEAEVEPQIPEAVGEEEEEIDVEEDRRLRSRKVYYLSAGADGKLDRIPKQPYSCRRIVAYLKKYEVGTVKQIAHALNLEKKTVGNAIAVLKQVKIVTSTDLPKIG
jgi:hypothetical protein